MGTSMQAGLAAIEPHIQEVIVTLGDQPLVTPDFLQRLTQIHKTGKQQIGAASYCRTVGVPVLFVRSTFPALMALAPDQGCKSVILNKPSQVTMVDCPEAALDIDTRDDYKQLHALDEISLP